jgi:hypothetical protein
VCCERLGANRRERLLLRVGIEGSVHRLVSRA